MSIAFLIWGMVTKSLSYHPGALWGAAASAFGYFAFYQFSRVLQSGAVSIAVPVFRLFFVVTAVLAIVFLNEPLTALKALGLVVAVLSVWLLLGNQGGKSSEISRESIIRILIAALVGGVPFVLFKLGLIYGASPIAVVVAQSSVGAVIAIFMARIIDKRFTTSNVAIQHGIAFGVVQALGFGILVASMVKGEASIVVPIGQLSFLVSALVGVAFLGERFSIRKLCGVSAAVGAVALLAIASTN